MSLFEVTVDGEWATGERLGKSGALGKGREAADNGRHLQNSRSQRLRLHN